MMKKNRTLIVTIFMKIIRMKTKTDNELTNQKKKLHFVSLVKHDSFTVS